MPPTSRPGRDEPAPRGDHHQHRAREDKDAVGPSADGQAPDPQRVVPDDHDAPVLEVLVDLRNVGDQQAGELLDPAADHPTHEHHRRAGLVGGGEQVSAA